MHWHLPDGTITRQRLYDGKLQESLLDQILTSDPVILNSYEILAPVSKSDHLGILSTIAAGNQQGYIRSEKIAWSKLSPQSIVQTGSSLRWSLDVQNPSVNDIWELISGNIKAITKTAPVVSKSDPIRLCSHQTSVGNQWSQKKKKGQRESLESL